MSVFTNIENEIKNIIDNTGLTPISSINKLSTGISEIPSDLRYPAISWAIKSGTVSNYLSTELSCNLSIQFVVIFQNHSSEKDARHSLYPCLEALISLLSGKNLNGNCSGLIPVGFSHVLVNDSTKLGTIAFRLDFKTSCDIQVVEDENNYADLEEILNKYKIEETIILENDLIEFT